MKNYNNCKTVDDFMGILGAANVATTEEKAFAIAVATKTDTHLGLDVLVAVRTADLRADIAQFDPDELDHATGSLIRGAQMPPLSAKRVGNQILKEKKRARRHAFAAA